MAISAKDIQLRELKDTISQLNNTITTQNELIRSLRLMLEEKTNNEKTMKEQLDFLTRKLFGASSEKRTVDIPGQLYLFDEAEQEAVPAHPEEEISVAEHKRKAKATHAETFKGLKVTERIIPLADEDKICSVCGTPMEYVGKDFVRRELSFIPAKCEIVEIYREVYACPSCKEGTGDTEVPVFAKATVPAALIPKSYASESAVAWTIYQKYANSMPLYRQEKDWKQYGAELSRTTLANWIIHCSKNYFRPLYDYFHRELLKRSFAMADETRIQVLNEPDRRAETQSFMWLFRSGEDGLPPIILYQYTETRNGDHASDFLNGFVGYLATDGYQGYNKVPGIKRCSCWAHIRRYFIDAIPKGKQYDYSQPAVQGVQYCDRLFRIEDYINSKYPDDYEKRKQLRLEKEKPILEAFWSWLESLRPVVNSRMYKAVNYVKNRKATAETYLEDGRCSFTNNLSENAIRPFTVGRKNWLFSKSQAGAEASAIVYSIVEMAKAYDLNIYGYLKFVLAHRPDESWTDEQLATIAPWSIDPKDLEADN